MPKTLVVLPGERVGSLRQKAGASMPSSRDRRGTGEPATSWVMATCPQPNTLAVASRATVRRSLHRIALMQHTRFEAEIMDKYRDPSLPAKLD